MILADRAAGARRPGFEKLLAAICEGRVGAVLSLEASRLARNGRDWHTLLEFCGLVGTLIVDEDGVYDAASPNDRLLLGMKGTMSEMELSVFRQRSIEAMRQKARRGELFLTVAVGYMKATALHREGWGTRASEAAIALVFASSRSFRRFVRSWCGAGRRRSSCPLWVEGKGAAADRSHLASCPSIRRSIPTNPVYAGAYAFGRRTAGDDRERAQAGRARSMQRDWRQLGGFDP